jgi:prepilin-type N-terminal cleavage/methylation domain-containing protein
MRVGTATAFTLLEMLVAIAVVSLMMVFMFGVAGQTVRGWEVGNRRMESAQSARIGMNIIANELRYAFAGSVSNASATGSIFRTNIAPFVVTNALPGETSASIRPIPGSQSIFFTAPIGPHNASNNSAPFAEVGYLPFFISDPRGINTLIGPRYYLVRHGFSSGGTNNASFQDFYYRGALNANWMTNRMDTANRGSLVDNCIRFSLQFASNNNGTIVWRTNWASPTNLPLGVLVTLLVLDSKSAARIGQLNGNSVLSATQIDQATNGKGEDPISRTLREGTTVIQRFVPLVNSSLAP